MLKNKFYVAIKPISQNRFDYFESKGGRVFVPNDSNIAFFVNSNWDRRSKIEVYWDNVLVSQFTLDPMSNHTVTRYQNSGNPLLANFPYQSGAKKNRVFVVATPEIDHNGFESFDIRECNCAIWDKTNITHFYFTLTEAKVEQKTS